MVLSGEWGVHVTFVKGQKEESVRDSVSCGKFR